MTTRLAAIVCTLALVTTPASARASFPSDAAVQELLQQLVEGQEINGIVVGLLDETGVRRVIAYGDPGPGALPLDGDSVFEIGSAWPCWAMRSPCALERRTKRWYSIVSCDRWD